MERAFESDAFAASEPPKLKELRTLPQRKAFAFLEKNDPEQVRREAEKEAAFEARMSADRQLQEERYLANDALALAGLLEQLEQPAAEKAKAAKEAEGFKCRGCTVEYTDATSSGAKTKKNYGYCSKTCRDGKGRCKHGRYRSKCKDCGTGQCQHKLWKTNCKDCGNRQQPIGNRQQPIANRQ
jgi:hypothetical protein